MYKSNTTEQLFKHSRSAQVISLPILGDGYNFLGHEVKYHEMLDKDWLYIDESDYLGLPDTY